MFWCRTRDEGIGSRFKATRSKEQRMEESRAMIEKYPDRVPVFVEPASNSDQVPTIEKGKFSLPCDLTVAQFTYLVRKRIALSPEIELFLSVSRGIPHPSTRIGKLHDHFKDEDGFLYFTYSTESTFGRRLVSAFFTATVASSFFVVFKSSWNFLFISFWSLLVIVFFHLISRPK